MCFLTHSSTSGLTGPVTGEQDKQKSPGQPIGAVPGTSTEGPESSKEATSPSRGGCVEEVRSKLVLRNKQEFTKMGGKNIPDGESTCANA